MTKEVNMNFFFPDSHDFIDPSFDFYTEKRSPYRIRQRDDLYAHEAMLQKPYDGLLISKAFIDGIPDSPGRTQYSPQQKFRFYRERSHTYFRLPKNMLVMGDCGAFAYSNLTKPPFTTDEVIEFYCNANVDMGISLDHIVFDYESKNYKTGRVKKISKDRILKAKERIEISLFNAEEFIKRSKSLNFIPYGVAHGWNNESYLYSVNKLQKMGFKNITLGGLIPLRSDSVLSILEDLKIKTKANTEYHLLGINRLNYLKKYQSLNVSSIDSTSPLKQAFKDRCNNYYYNHKNYIAIKIPHPENNNNLKKKISSGKLSIENVRRLEYNVLNNLRYYDKNKISLEKTLNSIIAYEELYSGKIPNKKIINKYIEVLSDKPWKDCNCDICKSLSIDVIIIRGSEWNKRRGFHNLHVIYKMFSLLGDESC